MHIVTTTSQVVNVIPRAVTLTVTLELRNEQTRETTTKEITGSLNGNFVQYDLDFSVSEADFYTFKLKDGTDLLYYGVIFCTNETNYDAYRITEGDYTTPVATSNDYKFA